MANLNTGIAGATAGAAIGGPVGGVVGGLAGFFGGGNDDSNKYLNDALKAARNIPLPVLKEYMPEIYQQVVSLDPSLIESAVLGSSAMDGITTDPVARQAQLSALSEMQKITDAGGMTMMDKAQLAKIQGDINANLQGQTGAIQQNLAAKGMSGGMSELVARNMAAQQAANRQSQQGLDVAAQAQARALQAIMNQGQMAGNLRSQDFGEAAQKAQAQDAIAKFNAQNLQNTREFNATNKNQAQAWNAQNAQNVANQNTGVRNQAQQYNLNLDQQNFNNQLSRLGLQNQALNQMAQNSANQAANQNQFIGGLIDSAGQMYAGSRKKTEEGSNW